jgi:O-antigen/teichoic acid export membrane protein
VNNVDTAGGARPLASGAALAAMSRIAVMVAGVTTTLVLTRTLGSRGWGDYVVAQSVAAILLTVSTLGVEHGVMFFVSSGRWSPRAALGSALRLGFIASIVAVSVAVAVRVLVPAAFGNLPIWLTAVAAASLPFALAWLYVSSVALAVERYELAMVLPVVQAVLVLAFTICGSLVFGRTGAVVGMALGTGIVGIAAVEWGSRNFVARATEEGSLLRQAVAFGIKGYAANALQTLNYRVDFFILSAVASTATVGVYGLAVAIASLLWLLPGALSDVLFPRVARLTGSADDTTRDIVESKSLRLAMLAALIGAVALGVGAKLLITPVFGESFNKAANLVLILLPGAAAVGVSSVLSAAVVGRGRPAYSLVGALLSTPITLVMYATLIPAFGATGAALASTISYLFSFVLVGTFYRRVSGRGIRSWAIVTRDEVADLRALFSRVGR